MLRTIKYTILLLALAALALSNDIRARIALDLLT